MTEPEHAPVEWTDEEKALIRAAVPTVAGPSSARIAAVMKLAQKQRDAIETTTRSPQIGIFPRMVAMLALMAMLAGGGYWIWNGYYQDELSFGDALDALQAHANREQRELQLALGHIHSNVSDTTKLLNSRDLLTDPMRASLRDALTSAAPLEQDYEGGFEAATAALLDPTPMATEDVLTLISMLKAGIYRVRQVAVERPELENYVKNVVVWWRRAVDG